MLQEKPDNLLEIDVLIDNFVREHKKGILTMHRVHLKETNSLSIKALVTELMEELKTGCVAFLNKNDDMSELYPYLFYIANDFYKKKANSQVKKKTEYICPGCLLLKNDSILTICGTYLRCENCEEALKDSTDPKMVSFFRCFFKHNRNGYRCSDCDRFIPHPLDNSIIISCPYYDCMFVGSLTSLKRMHHPSIQSIPERLILDSCVDNKPSFKDSLPDNTISALSRLEIQEDVENKINVLREVIESQKSTVNYSSSDFTIPHKILTYKAFDNLVVKFPTEMIGYLLEDSRSGGFQHKLFQEYIKLLEESLPFSYKKGKKIYRVESLLDENIKLFDGISTFEEVISTKLDIKNSTKEFYIGGRKASYSKPFYIGKILSVIDKNTEKSLNDQIVEYSFSKIKMRDVSPGTLVTVTHLRVPPHYQMGGMVYVNRVRKKIVERAHSILNREINE